MSPIFLKLGSFVIRWYTVMIVVAMLGAARVVRLEAARLGWDVRAAFWLVVKCTLVGLLGAHLLYAATRLDVEGRAFWLLLIDPRYGHVWFGGLLAAWAYCAWYARRHGLAPKQLYDVAALAVLVAQPLGRLGCLLEGCCYGRPTTLAWGVVMKHSEYGEVPLHPVQLYEALYLLLAFAWLWRRRVSLTGTGRVAAWYLILVPFGRLFAEVFRGDTIRGFVIPGLSTSSFISLLLLLVGVWLSSRTDLRDPSAFEVARPSR
jgi:phosphatidylglycerol:prolipoprotein diacylglycerol transferase